MAEIDFHAGQSLKDLLTAQVHRSVPKAAGVIRALGIARRRGGVKIAQLWKLELPRTGKAKRGGGHLWAHQAGDQVFYLDKDSGCLQALSLDDGSKQWKNCVLPWVAPPRFYKGKLYAATGYWSDAVKPGRQGFMAVDPGTGAVKRILRLPRSGDPQDRFMHPPFGRITYGVVYILGRGPRLHAIRVAAAE